MVSSRDVQGRYKGGVLLVKDSLRFRSERVALFSHTTSIAPTMATSGKGKEAKQRKEELDSIARISLDIRKAVIATLPAPPEQFLTLNAPGKVLNFKVRGITSVRRRFSLLQPHSRTLPMGGTRMATLKMLYHLSAFSSMRPSFATTCPPSAVSSSVQLADLFPAVTARRLASSARLVGVSLGSCVPFLIPRA